MTKKRFALKIRKIHRYLGLFLGIQFLFWTLSGIYFSWTDIDEIHGDHYKNLELIPQSFDNLISPSEVIAPEQVNSVALRDINNVPYYWINDTALYNAIDGTIKPGLTEQDALYVAGIHMNDELTVKSIERIDETNKHHEYRDKLLPAYVISYNTDDALKAYVSVVDGKFQTVRHRSWRWFDFLWMTHTMDYESRDNFNTNLLRGFSVLGLITVLSGFILWYVSSKSVRKLQRRI